MRRDHIAGLLPAAYQRALLKPSSVLNALLEVMEGLHERSEQQLAAVEDLFHPYRCPDRMVAFLTHWVAADHLGARRDVVSRGAAVAQIRGTAAGLRDAISVATGLSEVEVEEPADRPFHLIVRVPAHAAETVKHIVELEKPAATTFEMGEL
ncbi:phage tail protein [Allorhizocola rhizosphaerae]|uniref:phage tail protein n=1 Tax=Allorhizocola rhizosphaerae TaxID=1872709 RepID=UPI000E3C766B|nr:phage tail protein [Allorhizocola rhizosphaerae]